MKNTLYKLFEHRYLTQAQAREILHRIAQEKYNEQQIASLITVFLMRNITVEELCGFRDALLEMRTEISFPDHDFIDIVGTGGDGKNTFNISTCASFVVAAAGYKVVKQGSYGASSVSGASNVLAEHGVRFSADADVHARSLDKCGVAYLHAPLFNRAMKAVAPVRKALGVRTFFNMLGPLIHPARPTYQLLGVYNLALLRLYDYVYQQDKEVTYAVVHSMDGYDEISLTADFKLARKDSEQIFTPESLGFVRSAPSALFGGDTPAQAKEIFDSVLLGTARAEQKNAVIANAAFALQLRSENKNIAHCIAQARESLESGKALATFKQFVALNT